MAQGVAHPVLHALHTLGSPLLLGDGLLISKDSLRPHCTLPCQLALHHVHTPVWAHSVHNNMHMPGTDNTSAQAQYTISLHMKQSQANLMQAAASLRTGSVSFQPEPECEATQR